MATTSDINVFHSQLPEAYLFHFLCVHYPSASQLLNSIERVTACLGMPCTHQHRLRFLVILLRMAKINCGIADPAFFSSIETRFKFSARRLQSRVQEVFSVRRHVGGFLQNKSRHFPRGHNGELVEIDSRTVKFGGDDYKKLGNCGRHSEALLLSMRCSACGGLPVVECRCLTI